MNYNEVLRRYDLRFKDNLDVVATFLIDIKSSKYVKNLRNNNINEKELVKILQYATRLFSDTVTPVNSLVIERDDWNIVFIRVCDDDNNHLYITVAKKRLALGALLSMVKGI